jgi:hypothetical protein
MEMRVLVQGADSGAWCAGGGGDPGDGALSVKTTVLVHGAGAGA